MCCFHTNRPSPLLSAPLVNAAHEVNLTHSTSNHLLETSEFVRDAGEVFDSLMVPFLLHRLILLLPVWRGGPSEMPVELCSTLPCSNGLCLCCRAYVSTSLAGCMTMSNNHMVHACISEYRLLQD